jgi:hypothetical protein
VSSLVGNNIAYNSVTQNIRNIYAINTKENDNIDLVFADGVYGNLPQGSFRVFYRTSNGLSYTIYPNELRGISISVLYRNKNNVEHTLTIGLALQNTVANSAASEDIDTIRANAPAVYYTQNRMITAEDYNLAPLLGSQNIVKIKSVNRGKRDNLNCKLSNLVFVVGKVVSQIGLVENLFDTESIYTSGKLVIDSTFLMPVWPLISLVSECQASNSLGEKI